MRYGISSSIPATESLLLVVAHQPNAADVASLLDAEPTNIASAADTADTATDVELDAGSFESINNNECSGYEDHQLTPTPSPGFVSENELQQENAHRGLQKLERRQQQQQQQQQYLNQREVVLTEDDYDDDTDPDSGTGEDLRSVRESSLYCEGHNHGPKGDMVYSLLSMLGTNNRDDMSQTLLAMSTSVDSCVAMRQSGCLPLLVNLLHPDDVEIFEAASDEERLTRERSAIALRNVVLAHRDDPRGRQEVRVLRLLEQVRVFCDQSRQFQQQSASSSVDGNPIDLHPGPAVAALMKLSFDEEHRQAICILGGLQAISELLQLDHDVNGNTDHVYHVTMRRYACMTLTNLTYGDAANKSLLCSSSTVLRAVIAQLDSPSEDLCQVASSVIRNLSWHADLAGKRSLREAGAVGSVVRAAIYPGRSESTLKSLLSALWNLSSHGPENKADVCAVPGSLEFLVTMLSYRGLSRTLAVPENAGGVLRNVSSHVAGRDDYRAVLRRAGCLPVLLRQLRSPSLTVVSNACGTLWNLSARCAEDQAMLLELGAVTMLKNLVNSRHRMISMGSAAALKNLLSAASTLGFGIGGGTGGVGGRMPISLLLESPMMTRSDSAASSPAPGLHMRRQRAFEEELNRRELSETCDNMESPNTSPTGTLESRGGSKSARSSSSATVAQTRRIQSPSPMRVALNPGGRLDAVLQSSICRSASSGGIVGSADNYAGEHRVRGILHRSSRLLMERLQKESVLQSSLLMSRSQTDDERAENPSFRNSPSPMSPSSSSPPIFDRQPRSVVSFLKKPSVEPTPEPNKHSPDFVQSSFTSLRSENVQLGDFNDLESLMSSTAIDYVKVESSETRDFETSHRHVLLSCSSTSIIVDDCEASNSDENPRITDAAKELNPSEQSPPSEGSFQAALIDGDDLKMVESLREDHWNDSKNGTYCFGDSVTSNNQSTEIVIPAGKSCGSGVLLDMSDLFQTKMRSPKRKPSWLLKQQETKSKDVIVRDFSPLVSQQDDVESPIVEILDDAMRIGAVVDDIAGVVAANDTKYNASRTGSFEICFSPLSRRKASMTSSQLSTTDIMTESFPAMTSSLLCDMTESVEGLSMHDSESELPSDVCGRKAADVLDVREEDTAGSGSEVAICLLGEREQSFSSSAEFDRLLEENANRVLLEIDASSLAKTTMTIGIENCTSSASPLSDVQLLEDETISLVSIDDDSDLNIHDETDDDDEYNDAVSNRTYDVGASDFKEDISSSDDENITKDGQYRLRRRRHRSRNERVMSSDDERSSVSSSEEIPVCSTGVIRPIGRPRIVKPGTAAAAAVTAKTAVSSDQQEPKGIRGKRKALYSSSKAKPAAAAAATGQTGTGPLSGNKIAAVRGRALEATSAKKEAILTTSSGKTARPSPSPHPTGKPSSVPGKSWATVLKQASTAGQTIVGPTTVKQAKKVPMPSVRGQSKSVPWTVSMSFNDSESTSRTSAQPVNSSASKDVSKPSKDLVKPSPPCVDRSKLAAPQTTSGATRTLSPNFRPKASRVPSTTVVTGRSENEPDVGGAVKSNTASTAEEGAKLAIGVRGESSSGAPSGSINNNRIVASGQSLTSSAASASAGLKLNKPEVKPRSGSTLSSTGNAVVQSKSTRSSAGADTISKTDAVTKTTVGGKSIVKPTPASSFRPSSASRTRSLGPAPTAAAPCQRNLARTSSPSMLESAGRRSPAVTRRAVPATPTVGGTTSRSRTSSVDSGNSLACKVSTNGGAPTAAAGRAVGVAGSQRSSSLGGFGYGRNHVQSVRTNVEVKDSKTTTKQTEEETATGVSQLRQVTTKPARTLAPKPSDKPTTSSSASKSSIRNTFILTRSSTYDKLTDDVASVPSKVESVETVAVDASSQADNDVSQSEIEHNLPSVSKTSTFTKRQPRWRQTNAAEDGEHDEDGKSKPAGIKADDTAVEPATTNHVVLRRVRRETMTTSEQQEVRRRSSRLSGHQSDSAGVQQATHRCSGNGLLSTTSVRTSVRLSSCGVSPRNSVNVTSSQAVVGAKVVQEDAMETSDRSGVLNDASSNRNSAINKTCVEVSREVSEQHPKQSNEETSKRCLGNGDVSSTTKKFGFIGGLWKRNRAATMPRRPTYEDIRGYDDILSATSANKSGCSKTLPVGTLPPKYFDMKKSTSSSERQEATVSPKRRTFSWWRRTPGTSSADLFKSSLDSGAMKKNESTASVSDTRRSRIPAAFGFGVGSTTKKKSIGEQPHTGVKMSRNTVPLDRPPSPSSWASAAHTLNNCSPAAVGPSSAAVTSGIGGLSITKTAMLIERRRIQRAKIAASAAAANGASRDDECGDTQRNKMDCGSSKSVLAAESTVHSSDSLEPDSTSSSSILVKVKHNFLMTTV